MSTAIFQILSPNIFNTFLYRGNEFGVPFPFFLLILMCLPLMVTNKQCPLWILVLLYQWLAHAAKLLPVSCDVSINAFFRLVTLSSMCLSRTFSSCSVHLLWAIFFFFFFILIHKKAIPHTVLSRAEYGNINQQTKVLVIYRHHLLWGHSCFPTRSVSMQG